MAVLFTFHFAAEMETTDPHYRLYESLIWVMLALVVAFFVLAPLGIAALARRWGLRRTAVVYAVLSALSAVATIVQISIEEF